MTRVIVFADTHGNSQCVSEALAAAGELSAVIHLGDGVRDGEKAARESGLEFWGVRGNEDYGVNVPENLLIKTDGWSILMTHGHQWDLNPYQSFQEQEHNMEQLAIDARRDGATCLLFGHTHRCYLENRKGILLCNPGSQYLGTVEPPTFAILGAKPGFIHLKILEKRGDGRWKVRNEACLRNRVE